MVNIRTLKKEDIKKYLDIQLNAGKSSFNIAVFTTGSGTFNGSSNVKALKIILCTAKSGYSISSKIPANVVTRID